MALPLRNCCEYNPGPNRYTSPFELPVQATAIFSPQNEYGFFVDRLRNPVHNIPALYGGGRKFEEHTKAVTRQVRTYVGNSEEARELLLEAYIDRLFQSADTDTFVGGVNTMYEPSSFRF